VPSFADTRGENLAPASHHDFHRMNEICIDLNGIDGGGFCLKHRLHAFFDIQKSNP
jgi:hypothetical protein